MKEYSEGKIIVTKDILREIKCDECNKYIENTKSYYEVTIGHKDWGNDSIDSIQELDICNDECLRKTFESYIKNNSRTKHIEVEKKVYFKEKMYD